jgi:hypothetical protein
MDYFRGLKKAAADVKEKQEWESLINNLEASFDDLKADVETAAAHARALSDVMRTPPKKHMHSAKARGAAPSAAAIAARADAKDPVKRVEVLITSAMATSALLDGGKTAAEKVLAKLNEYVLQFVTERPRYQNLDEGQGREPEPHGDDVDTLLAMQTFTAEWLQEATNQKKTVDAEAQQARMPKSA